MAFSTLFIHYCIICLGLHLMFQHARKQVTLNLINNQNPLTNQTNEHYNLFKLSSALFNLAEDRRPMTAVKLVE